MSGKQGNINQLTFVLIMSMLRNTYLFLALIACGTLCCLFGCIDSDEFMTEPNITSLAMSTNTIGQGQGFTVSIGFTDGDGDFGNSASDSTSSRVLIIDNRTDFEYTYTLPVFTESGASPAISGTVDIYVAGLFCLPVQPQPVADSLYLQVRLIDQAGNESETQSAGLLLLQCQ